MRQYEDWLRDTRGLSFATYEDLWRWSVTDLDAFWQSIWEHEGLLSPSPAQAVLAHDRMPHARWFPGAQVNYATQVLRHAAPAHAAGQPALIAENELGEVTTLSWPELQRQVGALALTLRELGVRRGDRVAAYLPNVAATVVAFLACASIGAVWSVCAPDMGIDAVVDRFRQIAPVALIATDGVHYAGRALDRGAMLQRLRDALPSVQRLVLLRSPHATTTVACDISFDAAVARNGSDVQAFIPEYLPFDHPLWIVYSSGTTGLPKPIVHGHGGVLLMQSAARLHTDMAPSYDDAHRGERYHWYSSTGWIMWNAQVAGLLSGTTIVVFDGSPGGSKERPDWGVLWRFAARHRVTWFGAGAAFYASCMKADVDLGACGDLTAVRALGSTGSPLAEDVQRRISAQFDRLGTPGIWWCNISGGTDFAGAFVTGHRDLAQVPGQMQCRHLGCAVESWNEEGRAVIDEVGELVCTRPVPSMPLYLWGDEGDARYLSSYFDVYPGVWRHGDWIRIGHDGGCVIYGRSDATINRHGLRMGTSELYAAIEALPEVIDSLVIDLEYLGRESRLIAFVVLREGARLDEALAARVREAVKSRVSPRFVPDDVVQVPAVPRTLSGKKQEVPIRKLLLGQPAARVLNRDAMGNPDCLDWYVDFAARQAHASAGA